MLSIFNRRVCRSIGQASCIILGEDESWETFKNLCTNGLFVKKINQINYDDFKVEQFGNLKYIFESAEGFTEELAIKESNGCSCVFKWLIKYLFHYSI